MAKQNKILYRRSHVCGAELWCWSHPRGSGASSSSAAGLPPGERRDAAQHHLAPGRGGAERERGRPAASQQLPAATALA